MRNKKKNRRTGVRRCQIQKENEINTKNKLEHLKQLMNVGDVYNIVLNHNKQYKIFILHKIGSQWIRGEMKHIDSANIIKYRGREHIITLHYSPILHTFCMCKRQLFVDLEYLKKADANYKCLTKMVSLYLPLDIKTYIFSFLQDDYNTTHDLYLYNNTKYKFLPPCVKYKDNLIPLNTFSKCDIKTMETIRYNQLRHFYKHEKLAVLELGIQQWERRYFSKAHYETIKKTFKNDNVNYRQYITYLKNIPDEDLAIRIC